MPNTVIAIRQSGEIGNTPSLGVLANGELALNYADGILYYKTASNTLGTILTSTPGGLDTEVQFNDGGFFGGDSGFTYNKTTNTLTVDQADIAGLNVGIVIQSSFDKANAANVLAQAAFDAANTGGGGANSFGQIVANGGTILATTSNDSLQIVGESGITVTSNISAKKVIVSVPAGYTFTTADYGFVYEDTNVIYDYGTL